MLKKKSDKKCTSKCEKNVVERKTFYIWFTSSLIIESNKCLAFSFVGLYVQNIFFLFAFRDIFFIKMEYVYSAKNYTNMTEQFFFYKWQHQMPFNVKIQHGKNDR